MREYKIYLCISKYIYVTIRDTMHYRLFFFFLLVSIACNYTAAQRRDTRALLDIGGQVSNMAVTPGGRVWLTTGTGAVYFSDDITKVWYHGFGPFVDTGVANNIGSFNNVSFFNDDIGIMTGYIRGNNRASSPDAFLFTKDGGKNWEVRKYGGKQAISSIYNDKAGRVWLGGIGDEIYISNDYAQQWRTVKLPFKKQGRIYGIHMYKGIEGIEGIAGQHNEILVTTDNWATSRSIPTPFDQEKYKGSREDMVRAVSQVFIWGDYYVIVQGSNIFYTTKKSIDWQWFPIDLNNIALEEKSKNLYGLSKIGEVILFKSPQSFLPVSSNALKDIAWQMKAVNNTVYLFCDGDKPNRCYKVSDEQFIEAIPYTTDTKIKTPPLTRKGKKNIWGVDQHHIYLSENNGKDWYRQHIADFNIADIVVLNDSTVMLWDGEKNHYRYKLGEEAPRVHVPKNSLKNFLKYPLKSVVITTSSVEAYFKTSMLKYEWVNNSTLRAGSIIESNSNDNLLNPRQPKSINNIISSLPIDSVLRHISRHPDSMPGIADFRISAIDKKQYLKMVDSFARLGADNERRIGHMSFYRNVPALLDTISRELLKEVLDAGNSEPAGDNFTIHFVNSNNDTVHIRSEYTGSPSAWHLPWHVEYKGRHFDSYSIELSRLVKNCLPKEFQGRYIFSNKHLLMDIADYFYLYR